jgi:hypothetical protein
LSQLGQLVQHQNAILLAEAIGWLHDYRKCSEQQLQVQSTKTTAQAIARDELTNRFNGLAFTLLVFSSVKEGLPDLLNQWSSRANNAHASFLRQYLSRCHNTAHFDKQEPLDSGKQIYPGTQISTAFGFETTVGPNLTNQLWGLPWNSLTTFSTIDRDNLITAVQSLFSTVGADTRRPINEITLWDWGLLVGALYKAALAAVVLGYQPVACDLHWRLLSVRTNALAYFFSVSRLPDLVARQNILQTAINNVQTLLEETYPLATEVYRDENGSLFVVPDLPHLLNLQDNHGQTLLTLIHQQFATDGEIVPQVTLDPNSWWGQDPRRGGNDQIPPAGAILSTQTTLQSDAGIIYEAWQNTAQPICPICGLRPCVSIRIDYCQVCGERRQGRVVNWRKNQNSTIWLDEVADGNSRLALITGTFDLTSWLNGQLVETMLVQEPSASNLPVTKTPSFARLRRIWQTTQQFWQTTQACINKRLADDRRRLLLAITDPSNLTEQQVYELDLLGATRMSVLWNGNHLISTDNLSYTAVQLNIKLAERKTPDDAALAVGAWLEGNKKQTFQLITDDEAKRQFAIQIADIDYQDADYATTIPILAEPRTFMALVPADKALDVLVAIKTKYEREMGKVRNRLPLHLGAVYFHRRTPLRAALDAGRRMLRQKPLGGDQPWCVKEVKSGSLPNEAKSLACGTKHFDQTITLKLVQGERTFTWHVPAVMGDGVTPDNWYPYVFFCADKDGQSDPRQCAQPRACLFKGLRPKSDNTTQECWLIHAAQLQPDDQVYFTPARFDFEWLDSSGRRFEIAYDEAGQRLTRPTRPYLLDDLATIQELWKMISSKDGLTSSQIYALRDLVEAKRERWGASDAFHQLCHDAVRNAQWKNRTIIDLNLITTAAISGLLADVIELYMGIMKEQPHRTKEDASL